MKNASPKFYPDRAPFPGIRTFEAADAAIYFGRDDETRAVIERLDACRTQGGARLSCHDRRVRLRKILVAQSRCTAAAFRRRREWVVLPYIRPEKAPIEMLAKSIAQQIGKPDDWRVWRAMLGGADAIDHVEKLLKDLRVGPARGGNCVAAYGEVARGAS